MTNIEISLLLLKMEKSRKFGLIEKSFDIDNMSIQESEKYSESRSDIDKTFDDLRVDFDLPAN